MPNRTIYVSDQDEPMYRRAQELAGDNLSAAISNALKHYVEAEDARAAGYEDIVVKVGTGAGRKVRFLGVLLGDWITTAGERFEHYRVWRGKAGRFAIHVERAGYWESRDAQGNLLTGWRSWTGIGAASGGGQPGHSVLDVVDTLDELRERVPKELYDMVAQAVDHPVVEDLDL